MSLYHVSSFTTQSRENCNGKRVIRPRQALSLIFLMNSNDEMNFYDQEIGRAYSLCVCEVKDKIIFSQGVIDSVYHHCERRDIS